VKNTIAILAAFLFAMAFAPTAANAVVCARGVARAGCVGPHGAVVVRRSYHPVVVAPMRRVVHCGHVNGVRICR
jgi:hypothetical protein